MLYLWHGPDRFTRAEALAELKSSLGDPSFVDLNTTLLDGRQLTLTALVQACDANPFLSPQRLVIVEGLLARLPSGAAPEEETKRPAAAKGRALLAEVLDYLPKLPATTCLVLVEDAEIKDKDPLYKAAAASGPNHIRFFPQLAGRELEPWIVHRAQAKGAQILPPAVKALTQYVGNDLNLLDNELEKLASYSSGEPIGLEEVQRLVSAVREESIFHFVDALGERNGPVAIELFHQLLEDGGDASYALYLLSMMVRQFRLLLQVKELLEQHAPAPEMMRALATSSRFMLDKLTHQTRNFSLDQLKAIFGRLQHIDVDIKSGKMDAKLALDLFIAEMCRGAKAPRTGADETSQR